MTKIDQLPVEMLMKIFSYLPRYDNVSLVNKHFYDVACKVNDSNVCVTLRSCMFEKEPLLQSIQNTNRKITKVCIAFDCFQLRSVISVIKKFSATIKCLTFFASSLRLEMSDVFEILSLVRNAEYLNFRFLKLKTNNEPLIKTCHMVPSNEDLKLHQLKKLELNWCQKEFLVVFNRLPTGVLTQLRIDSAHTHELNVLFKRQSNIKKLSINFYRPFDSNIFDDLKLESLKILNHSWLSNYIATILSKQTKLESLEVYDSPVDDDAMNIVTNQLAELATLSIDVTEITVATFVNIEKLKKLKDLALLCNENMAVLKSFANLNNSGITNLDIIVNCDISVDLIHALAWSVPNLKVLRFSCNHDFVTINALLRSFNYVEVLEFDNYTDNENDNIRNLIQGDCFNPKLIELSINCRLPYETSIFEKFIVDYPNLQSLYMRSSTPLSASQLELISNGFRKMNRMEIN